jgi:hypothetical protein
MDGDKMEENQKKGLLAEKGFADFLNGKQIPFYHIDQKKDEYYSEELHEKKVRRPDFIVHTRVGLFHVDVKFRIKKEFGGTGETRFYLDRFEIKRLFNLETESRSQVWIAFTDDLDNFIFHYASISDINRYCRDISETYEKTYAEKHRESLWFFIPDRLLYDNLSFERGVFRELDVAFIEREVNYYRVRSAAKPDNHLRQ